MTTFPPVPADDVASLRREFDKLRALVMVQSARITALEQSAGSKRKKARVVGADDVPLKTAAHELGLSVNGVKYHCADGNLRSIKVGGRVFIDRKSMEVFKAKQINVMQNCSARASNRVG